MTRALPTARATHEPSPTVSAVPVGIANAELLRALENICANAASSAYIEVLHAGRVKRRTSRFGLLRETYSHEYAAAARDGVHRYLWPQLIKLAQGIEARSGETGTGSTVGESPVAKPCAQS